LLIFFKNAIAVVINPWGLILRTAPALPIKPFALTVLAIAAIFPSVSSLRALVS
jgi:hypothetical protein